MSVEGTLDLFQLPEILQLIAQQKKTGILTVQGQQDIVAISFLNGWIVAADALNQTMEEGLARLLLSEGVLGAPELGRAMAEHQATGSRLIELLVGKGYVTRPRLLAVLRLQTYRLVEQLLRWDEGDFKFYSGEEVSYEEGLAPISVEELLLHSLGDEPRKAAPPLPPRPVSPPSPPRPAHPIAVPAPSPARTAAPAGAAAIPAAPAGPPVEAASRRAALPSLAAVVGRVEPALALPRRPSETRPAASPGPAPQAGAERGPAAVFRKMKVEELAVPRSYRVIARLLALVPAALLVVVLLGIPGFLVLPFPWQDGQRQALAQAQRAPLYLKIDRAAKTFYLLEGRFPERLAQLQQAGLLAAGDLHDPQGYALRYAAREEGYVVQPVDGRGAPIAGAESTEAITGNFLLDPDFISVSPDSQAPLVLVD